MDPGNGWFVTGDQSDDYCFGVFLLKFMDALDIFCVFLTLVVIRSIFNGRLLKFLCCLANHNPDTAWVIDIHTWPDYQDKYSNGPHFTLKSTVEKER